MSKGSSGSDGMRGALFAGGGMALVLALGVYIGFGRSDVGEAEESLSPVVSTPSVPQSEPADPSAAQTVAPRFDTVRRETDGTTIIAGRAAPMTEVRILLDGAQVATATTDSTGGFAAITTLPPKDVAQVVTLSAGPSGTATASADEVILAPSAPAVAPSDQVAALDADATATDASAAPAPQAAALEQEVVPEPPQAEQSAQILEPEPEKPRIAVIKSDADGVSLLSPPSEAMTAVALDTIGYSEMGEVQLSGRALPDTARVRVYLDNRSVIELPVGNDGRWRGDLPDVDEGVYTLRVDAVDAVGVVSSRVETPFKRESAETLAQANAGTAGPVRSITVQTGATLWAIARDRYGDGTLYVRVFEANAGSIRDPDLIYPGQVFDLPN
jgi:nucleoid-associated protein YgaU